MIQRRKLPIMLSLVALGGGAPHSSYLIDAPGDIDGVEIAWTQERYDSWIFVARYDLPASITPIEDDGAATGGFGWKSFDGKTTIDYEDKATYFDINTKREYYHYTWCRADSPTLGYGTDAKFDKTGESYCRALPNKKLIIYKDEEVPTDHLTTVRHENRICADVFGIAPDQIRDKSRGIVNIKICSEHYARPFIRKLSTVIFNSLNLKYSGKCDKEREDVIGCN